MAEHMQTVRSLREEQSQIRDDFARDMMRFRELKADSAPPTTVGPIQPSSG